jgi:hypothetical protein
MPAMMGQTSDPWMALAIMADATEVMVGRIGQENVSAKVDALRGPHEAPASARKSFALARVETGLVPKAVELILHTPAHMPCPCSQVSEPFSVGSPLDRLQV